MNRCIRYMKWLKKLLLTLLALPLLYFVISFITTYIPINLMQIHKGTPDSIYLHSNGVHLDIALHKDQMDSGLFKGLIEMDKPAQYYSFGWGDENFYLNTPEWSDLTVSTAFKAAFLKSPSLMHVTRYESVQPDWKKVPLDRYKLSEVKQLLSETFTKDSLDQVIILDGKGYSTRDDFYRANGHYHLFNTCNSWANEIFKQSGLRACLWTPFDFGLLRLYEE